VAAALALFYQIPVAERLARAAEARAGGGEASDATQTDAFAGLRKRSAIVGSLIGFLLIVLVGLGTFRVP